MHKWQRDLSMFKSAETFREQTCNNNLTEPINFRNVLGPVFRVALSEITLIRAAPRNHRLPQKLRHGIERTRRQASPLIKILQETIICRWQD